MSAKCRTINGNLWEWQSDKHWICWVSYSDAHSVRLGFLGRDGWWLSRKMTMSTRKTYGPYSTMRKVAEQVPEGEQVECLEAAHGVRHQDELEES